MWTPDNSTVWVERRTVMGAVRVVLVGLLTLVGLVLLRVHIRGGAVKPI
jgi:hypothetical protein